MKQLRKIQEHGLKWTFDFGADSGSHDVLVLKLPLQFIIGDYECHNRLAGCFKGHTHICVGTVMYLHNLVMIKIGVAVISFKVKWKH
jgi:hypothetical protein